MSCLGDAAAALVDGELGDAARERALRHLVGCDGCKAEVAAQRRLKSSLSCGGPPPVDDALTARLLAFSSATMPPSALHPSPPRRAGLGRAGVAVALVLSLGGGVVVVQATRDRTPVRPMDPSGGDGVVTDVVGPGGGTVVYARLPSPR